MLSTGRCLRALVLTLGIVFNILFIGLMQRLYFSHFSVRPSSSSSSSPSSEHRQSIERPGLVDHGDTNRQGISVKVKIQNGSLPLRTASQRDIVNALKRTQEGQVSADEIIDVKQQIMQRLKYQNKFLNPEGRSKQGASVPLLLQPNKFCRGVSRLDEEMESTKTSAMAPPPALLVIMVTSSVRQIRARKAIRRSWADVSEVRDREVRVVFLLGRASLVNGTATKLLVTREAKEFDDVVQGDFDDTYENLTVKTLMGLEWAATRCRNSFKFMMKTDSDVYVNIPKIAEYLRSYRGWKEPRAFGRRWDHVKPIRSPAMKWFVPPSEYPDPTYPPYLGGSAYIMTSSAAQKSYREARSTRLVSLEDIFIGLCFNKAGVKLRDDPRISLSPSRIATRPCDVHYVFTHHSVRFYNFKHLKETQDHPERCQDLDTRRDGN